MDLIGIITLLGILNGFLLGIALLFLHRGNRKANRVLGVLVMITAFLISGMWMMSENLYTAHPHYLMITQPWLFLFGPLFWLYVEIMTQRIETFRPRLLLHAVPFFACALYRVPFYMLGADEKLAYYSEMQSPAGHADLTITFIQLFQILVYLYLVLRILREHESAVKKEYSIIEKINLAWVRHFVYAICGIAFVMALFLALDLFGFGTFVHRTSGMLGILLSLGLGVYGLRQPEIFLGLLHLPETRNKYINSTVSSEKSDELLRQLNSLMETDKPYRDGNLTVHDLAAKMGIPGYQLSQIINERLGQNFFDFVNRYRVEDMKRQMADPARANYTLMAIALDAGFNSKSVFNTAFRKYTGMTPSEFRRNL